MKKYTPLFILTPLVFVLDHLTKFWVVQNIPRNSAITLIEGFFELNHVRNYAGPFGIGSSIDLASRFWIFIVINFIALALMGFMYYKSHLRERSIHVSLALIFGGALGNIIDRIWRGNVVDFIHLHWQDKSHELALFGYKKTIVLAWPSFNVADIAITCAALYLAISILFGKDQHRDEKQTAQGK